MAGNQWTSLTKSELVDKIKGIVYGGAIGDGIGLATEFVGKDQARLLYGNGPIKFGKKKGHPIFRDGHRNRFFENDFTDDTDQMLLILQSILADNGTINPMNFAFRLNEWCKIGFPELNNKAPRGIGFTVGSTTSHGNFLSNPLQAAFEIWNKNDRNLAANGAVMRTGIVGAPYFWDEEKVVENAMMAAKVTHADPRSVTSAVIVSVVISRLLRGSLTDESSNGTDNETKSGNCRESFMEMIQLGSTEDSFYLEKFKDCSVILPKQLKTPLHRYLLRQTRRVVAHAFTVPFDPSIDTDFNIPIYKKEDINKRLETPVELRENIQSIDEYGFDEGMMNICKEVVNSYSFLLENHSLCPTENNKWVSELHSHSFPESLSSLKLAERDKIGYTLKCLGAGLYLGTRKIPEGMTSADFFENLITQLLLETGDADTNCAVAGSILGARLGKSGLPKEWVTGLRHREFIEEKVEKLCDAIFKTVSWND